MIYRLDQLAKIKYGKNQRKVEDPNGEFPIFGTGGLMGHSREPLYSKPSVLIGRKGTIDKVRFVTKPFWTVDTLFYTEINESLVLPYYFYCLLQTVDLAQLNEGTTIPSLRTETLNRLEFNIPDIATQKRIASILSAIDEKIETNIKLINNLHTIGKAMYLHLVDGAPVERLSSLIDVVETGSRPKGGAVDNGYPSIGAEKIERFGIFEYQSCKYISREFFHKLRRGIVKSGDVLIYKDGAYTGKSSMALNGFPYKLCAVNEHVFIARTKDSKYQSFLYFSIANERLLI